MSGIAKVSLGIGQIGLGLFDRSKRDLQIGFERYAIVFVLVHHGVGQILFVDGAKFRGPPFVPLGLVPKGPLPWLR